MFVLIAMYVCLRVGSERQSTTGASGTRLKEASSINKSLSTLGLVIMSLADTKSKKPKHVPYRDSKLTFLLQDSLGGNANAVMIANISPSTKNINETLSTLRFARGAKRVKNKAVANHDCVGNISSLKAEIALLKQELKTLKDKVRRFHALLLAFLMRSLFTSVNVWSTRLRQTASIWCILVLMGVGIAPKTYRNL